MKWRSKQRDHGRVGTNIERAFHDGWCWIGSGDPRCEEERFDGDEDELLLRLNAPALEGKANKAAAEFIAEYFALPRSSVALVAGEKSRHKVFELIGLGIGDIERKVGRPAAQNH